MENLKEIGGYFGMEELPGKEYYADLTALNLGRTALLHLLAQRNYTEILLPYYLCDSVISACKSLNIKVSFYHLDENLVPQTGVLPENACLYLVNYYGQLTDEKILEYRKKYNRILVDHTHAFYQRPLEAVDTIYSCRKFFGLPDGAYLSGEHVTADALPEDFSASRMEHILGRYEKGGHAYYDVMLKNAASFHEEEPRRMSRLTHNLLRGINYKACAEKRSQNYDVLASVLSDSNPLPFVKPEVPMCYPYYTADGPKIRAALARQKIYVPVYWKNVTETMPEDSIEYRYASNILPLPCDQRYSEEDMKRILTVLQSLHC